MRLLLVEDDPLLSRTVSDNLRETYSVDAALTGKQALNFVRDNDYDLIVLDLTLPDMDGLDICRKVRSQKIKTPLLMLTARTEINQRVEGLDAGADDYLSKPFSFTELHARLRAMLRRSPETLPSNILIVGDLVLDPHARTVTREGKPITLRRKEFDLLEYFMRNPGNVMTRSMILEHVWDSAVDPFTNSIDVHIKYLRDRIDRPFATPLIQTVHGLGYKLEVPISVTTG